MCKAAAAEIDQRKCLGEALGKEGSEAFLVLVEGMGKGRGQCGLVTRHDQKVTNESNLIAVGAGWGEVTSRARARDNGSCAGKQSRGMGSLYCRLGSRYCRLGKTLTGNQLKSDHEIRHARGHPHGAPGFMLCSRHSRPPRGLLAREKN